MCLKDRERFDEDLEELREENADLLKKIECLTRRADHLSALLHDLFNGEALYQVGINLKYL
jgi:hypothetical protein